MSKTKTKFICQECGYETSGWMGKCPSCSSWNSFVEEKEVKVSTRNIGSYQNKPEKIQDIKIKHDTRQLTGIHELDRVLGGGFVDGSLILIGGEPGIGKSTLLLQICRDINKKILYVSGEESAGQIKLRADRLNVISNNLYMVSETSFDSIRNIIENEKPELVIIDSIQTVYCDDISSAPGSVSQVREVTANLLRISKGIGITVIVVGHVTKEGSIAGPRVLEHMVDTVLYFEGERHQSYRVLRAVKNRFGSTNEIGIFEMAQEGLIEVSNPSEIMLSGRSENQPGSAVVATLEGSRPMLIEIQALVAPTSFGMPRRMAAGIDYNRVVMLMAVLEKKVGLPLHNFDAYLNVVGGLKLNEPACDLGIIAATASSYKNIAIDRGSVFIGEVGLTGEVRLSGNLEKRIIEAERLGFKTCYIPKNKNKIKSTMEIKSVDNVSQLLNFIT